MLPGVQLSERVDSSCSHNYTRGGVRKVAFPVAQFAVIFFEVLSALCMCAGTASSGCALHGRRAESPMQNSSSALFAMVSHCQTATLPDFTGLSLAVYGGKADVCARRAGFGAQTCRSSPEAAAHMNCASPKRLTQSEEKAHLSGKPSRSCLSLPQGKQK